MTQELSELLFNGVNEQGYLFQEACELVLKTRETGWEVIASEYPVSLQAETTVGQPDFTHSVKPVSLQAEDTRVDILLRARSPSHPELYALVECKRADPEYVYWLFGAPGLPDGDALCYTLGFECSISETNQPLDIKRLVKQLGFKLNTYDPKWWVEVKRNSPKRVSTPQNIETAFGQVLRGVAGFAQEQLAQRRKAHQTFKTFFVPVVITTASLYVAYYRREDVNLSTGKISKDKVLFGPKGQSAEEIEWVLVDYGVGENVAPKPIPENYVGVDPAELQKHKIRSIFVVNSKSIQSFFSKLSLAVES